MRICTNPVCESVVSEARFEAGYSLCHKCSDAVTHRHSGHVINDEEGNPQLIRARTLKEYEQDSAEIANINVDDIIKNLK